VLSGIGGDEFTGGVPTPVPELADLVARARFRRLARQLKAWALAKRKPWFHLFFETASRFLPSSMGRLAKHRQPPLWLDPAFIKRHRLVFSGYEERLQLSRALPSFQEAVSTLDALRRQLSCEHLHLEPPYEKRYPYLDRDLLEFLCAIPREQLVRPGERRSLMRRALAGIVPDEILHRRRKAYMARTPLAAIAAEWENFAYLATNMVAASLGIVNAQSFANVLRKAREGKEVPIVGLMRTLNMEIWLRTREQPMSLGHRAAKSRVNLSRVGAATGAQRSLDELHRSLI
jgi:asparagine synthase (glutamine-hydrolysing)